MLVSMYISVIGMGQGEIEIIDLQSLTFWPYGLSTCGSNSVEYIP